MKYESNQIEKMKKALSFDAIRRALFENYESIYVIDVNSAAYICYYESSAFQAFHLENEGNNFFEALAMQIPKTIWVEDREYVLKKLDKDRIIEALASEPVYSFVYRLSIDGQPVYHKIRIIQEEVENRELFMLGVRNVDEAFRKDKEQTEEMAFLQYKNREKNKQLTSLQQKNDLHLEAILASALGYVEANLSRNQVVECSPFFQKKGESPFEKCERAQIPCNYSIHEEWVCKNQVVRNADSYERISNRNYLMDCYSRGEKRASVSFSAKTGHGGEMPCKKVFYLYQDYVSGDIFAFCLVYDLTGRQRQEKEMQELKEALRMSRIRNFTSQMQPHFLYNALGSIQEIVLEDPEYAYKLIGDFSVHLRSCIRAMTNDALIPFSQELENIRAYVNIEQMRFGNKLKIVYDIETDDFPIVPLSVQPVVENAIRHGIYQRGKQGGTVTIRTKEDNFQRIIQIKDDGVGFDTSCLTAEEAGNTTDSTGLSNVVFRLEKIMNAKIQIHSEVNVGTNVIITLPVKQWTGQGGAEKKDENNYR